MIKLEFSMILDCEKFHKMAELTMQDPSLGKVIDNHGNSSRELAFSFYILWIFSHAHAMRRRKVLSDNEWTGWLKTDEKLLLNKAR